MSRWWNAKELVKIYKGTYIDAYPHFMEARDEKGNWITLYEVRGISKKIKENFNLPEDCLVKEDKKC